MISSYLTLAVSKGYLLDETLKRLNKMGYEFEESQLKDSRKLFAFDKENRIRLLFIRPWDVSVYVEHGAADLGVVGKDVLLEKEEEVAELVDLKFGHCRLILACPSLQFPYQLFHHIRVATKYPHSCEQFFNKKGIQARILKMYGAIELAPLTGLSDIICDLTASGQTLKENQLEIIDTVFESSARLIANPVSLRLSYKEIQSFSTEIQKYL